MKEIIYQPKALKQLKKIPTKAHIIEKCELLKTFPDCSNIKALTDIVTVLVIIVFSLISLAIL